MLQRVGMGQLAKRDHMATQLEAEQPLAHQAHASMARIWEKEQHLNVPASDRCLMLDDGWNCSRNATGLYTANNLCWDRWSCAPTRLEHSRRSEPGIKSSQALEQRNCQERM